MKIFLEWLSLPKAPFKILMFLLQQNPSSFTIDILLNFFMIDKNATNTDSILSALDYLEKQEIVKLTKQGEEYKASIIYPEEETSMELDTQYFDIEDFRRKDFSEKIDWDSVLKVLLAAAYLDRPFTRNEIHLLTGLGTTTITKATKVLKSDFIGINYKRVFKKIAWKYWENKGAQIEIGAFISRA